MNVPAPTGAAGDGIVVAIIDTGIDGGQRETASTVVARNQFIPCDALAKVIGAKAVSAKLGIDDCGSRDRSGHGTWLASRIAAPVNGFASNGIAPRAKVIDQKAAADGYGFDSTWVLSAMLDSCKRGADVINMSLHEFDDPEVREEALNYLLWVDAVNYCRGRGTTIVAAAGNDHVRIDRANMTVGGRALSGVGVVAGGSDGFGLIGPGEQPRPYQGYLVAPGGVPGVIMVSATNNVVADGTNHVPAPYRFRAGARDQLAYYSNYGSRVDLAAPGGARAFNVPSFDASPADVFTADYGVFGATSPRGSLCDPSTGGGCFKEQGDAFMWLQGTSMATAQVSGAIARLLSEKRNLRGNPDRVLQRLQATATRGMANQMGPMSPSTAATGFGPCPYGFCHVRTDSPISFADAYGAGLVNVGAALG
jgi:subtilisin family serine protease